MAQMVCPVAITLASVHARLECENLHACNRPAQFSGLQQANLILVAAEFEVLSVSLITMS